MAGKIVKAIVLANLLASAVLVAWAVSEYFTRQDLVAAADAPKPATEDPYADDTDTVADDDDFYADMDFYAWLDAQDQDPQG